MTGYDSASSSAAQASPQAGGKIHQAYWTKLMLFFMARIPVPLAEWVCGPAALVFLCALGPQRRAVLQNLSALLPLLDAWERWFLALSTFRQFALTYLDRLYHLHFQKSFAWDLPDFGLLHRMQTETGGVLLFTAHSGNYDVGAALFAEKFGRLVHIVRVPERNAEMQSIREKEFRSVEHEQSFLRVHYNTAADAHLGLELIRLLQRGDVVAVQGDRVVMDISALDVTHGGVTFHLPRGPLILAEVTRCPCYPIFLSRTGSCRYRLHVGPPFVHRGETLTGAEVAARWLDILHPFLIAHPDQWFVFEALLSRRAEKATV
jgi:lauroyl/myristoyl acyltransferase